MPKKPFPKFNFQSNHDIANGIRLKASPDYQRHVPEATQANLLNTMQTMMDNPGYRNEFMNALVNKIGITYARGASFDNPLAKFKSEKLLFGDSIEEVQLGLAKAYVHDPTREKLEKAIYGREYLTAQASIHRVNRAEMFKLTIDENELRYAFTQDEGLSSFIVKMMDVLVVSDARNEYLSMVSRFRDYHHSGGFFKVTSPDVADPDSTDREAKTLLRQIRTYTGTLPFLSEHYNASGMPVSAKADELELFITPEAKAAIDVEALASMFNVGLADFEMRHTVIPQEHMGIPGVQAILTTRDYFVVRDTVYEHRKTDNPAELFDNHFLHHRQIVSTSRFVPAVLFWTGAGDTIEMERTPVVNVPVPTLYAWDDLTGEPITELRRGVPTQVAGSAITNPAGGINDGIAIQITGQNSPRTYVTQTGTLYVAVDESSEEIIIRAYSVDNPDIDETQAFPVVGEIVQLFPNPQIIDPDEDGDG